MPRYFFNLQENIHIIPDREGRVFSGIADARFYATKMAREIIGDCSGTVLNGWVLIVNDELGATVFTLAVSAVGLSSRAPRQRTQR
jgi:hypothetical protein